MEEKLTVLWLVLSFIVTNMDVLEVPKSKTDYDNVTALSRLL